MIDIPSPESREPALTVAGAASTVGAVIAVLVAFGVDLSEAQIKAILGLVLVAGPFLLGLITRARVYAPATVRALTRDRE